MHVLVLGAGQLARMMSLAGAPLNIEVTAFDVVSEDIVHPLTKAVVGHGLKDAITSADVITAEFEHIPHSILDICEQSGKFLPTTQAIKAGGDRRIGALRRGAVCRKTRRRARARRGSGGDGLAWGRADQCAVRP